jgi:group I intron endonuclease
LQVEYKETSNPFGGLLCNGMNLNGFFNFMKKIIGVYKITSPTKRVYIGQSVDVRARILSHKRGGSEKQPKLYASLQKYGSKKHIFELVCECPKEDLDKLEIYYIQLYNSAHGKHGLNCRDGGKTGWDVCAETSVRLKKEKKKMVLTDEQRKAISDRMKLQVVSQETREKLRQHNLGKKHSVKTKELCRLAALKKTGVSAETREKLRQANLGKKASPQERNRLRELSKHNIEQRLAASKLVCAKKIINIETGQVLESIEAGSKFLGIPKSTFNQYIMGQRTNKTPFVLLSRVFSVWG